MISNMQAKNCDLVALAMLKLTKYKFSPCKPIGAWFLYIFIFSSE